MLLLALTVTLFFSGIAQPVGLERAIETALVGVTLLLALSAAELKPPVLRAVAVAVIGDVNPDAQRTRCPIRRMRSLCDR